MKWETSTGIIISANIISELVRKVHQHEAANNLPLTAREVIENRVCIDAAARGRGNFCYDPERDRKEESPSNIKGDEGTAGKTGSTQGRFSVRRLLQKVKVRTGIEIARLVSGNRILRDWYKEGGYATTEQANNRATVCIACPERADADCASCAATAFAMKVARIKGNRSTPHDANLKHCRICGCSNEIKIWVPTKVLAAKDGFINKYPDNCWIKKEVDAYKHATAA